MRVWIRRGADRGAEGSRAGDCRCDCLEPDEVCRGPRERRQPGAPGSTPVSLAGATLAPVNNWIDSKLQAFCKRQASAAMPRGSVSKQRLGPDLAWNLRFGGRPRQETSHPRRLITRRSQVQILPPLFAKGPGNGAFSLAQRWAGPVSVPAIACWSRSAARDRDGDYAVWRWEEREPEG